MKKYSIVLALWAAAGAAAQTLESTPQNQAALGLTVYTNDVALVRDERTVDLVPGDVEIHFTGVSDHIIPESAQLRSDGIFDPAALSYRAANLDRTALMRGYLGETVTIVRQHPQSGEPIEQEAQLLSIAGDAPLVRVGDQVETVDANSPWRIVFPQVPNSLRGQPALIASGTTDSRGPQSIELTYLTHGLDWRTDYVVTLEPAGGRADVTAWLGLSNNTTNDYIDAALQVVAGSPDLAREDPPPAPLAERASLKMADESVEGYRVYTLDRPITLLSNEQRQLLWFEREAAPMQRRFLARGYALSRPREPEPIPVQAEVVLDPADKPLPQGIARVYSPDAAGRMQFVGSDRVEDTAAGEPLELQLGTTFDVWGTRTLTDLQQEEGTTIASWRLTLHNETQRPVDVIVEEEMGGDWTMVSETAPHEKASGTVTRWKLEVPARGQRTLEYQARISTGR